MVPALGAPGRRAAAVGERGSRERTASGPRRSGTDCLAVSPGEWRCDAPGSPKRCEEREVTDEGSGYRQLISDQQHGENSGRYDPDEEEPDRFARLRGHWVRLLALTPVLQGVLDLH